MESSIYDFRFVPGRLYTFEADDGSGVAGEPLPTLSGIVDRCDGTAVILEICSSDMTVFMSGVRLPEAYVRARPATAEEYSDFYFNYGWQSALKAVETRIGQLAGCQPYGCEPFSR